MGRRRNSRAAHWGWRESPIPYGAQADRRAPRRRRLPHPAARLPALRARGHLEQNTRRPAYLPQLHRQGQRGVLFSLRNGARTSRPRRQRKAVVSTAGAGDVSAAAAPTGRFARPAFPAGPRSAACVGEPHPASCPKPPDSRGAAPAHAHGCAAHAAVGQRPSAPAPARCPCAATAPSQIPASGRPVLAAAPTDASLRVSAAVATSTSNSTHCLPMSAVRSALSCTAYTRRWRASTDR